MTRQVTDQLYIEIGYHTPEEYYVYTAEAQSQQVASSTLSCDAGKITQAQATIVVTTAVSATISHIEGADLFAFSESQLAVQVDRIRDNNIEISTVFAVSTEVTRIKNLAADQVATSDIAVVNGRSRDFVLEAQAAFSFVCDATVGSFELAIVDMVSSTAMVSDGVLTRGFLAQLDNTSAVSVNETRIRDFDSTQAVSTEVSAIVINIRSADSNLVSETALNIDGQRVRYADSALASTSDITCTISHIEGADLSAFGQASITAQANVIASAGSTLAVTSTAAIALSATKRNSASIQLTSNIFLGKWAGTTRPNDIDTTFSVDVLSSSGGVSGAPTSAKYGTAMILLGNASGGGSFASEVTNNVVISAGENFLLEMWVWPMGGGAFNNQPSIAGVGVTTSTLNNPSTTQFSWGIGTTFEGRLQYKYNNNGTIVSVVSSTTNLGAGWNHLAFYRYNGNTLALARNGVEVATSSFSGAFRVPNTSTNRRFWVANGSNGRLFVDDIHLRIAPSSYGNFNITNLSSPAQNDPNSSVLYYPFDNVLGWIPPGSNAPIPNSDYLGVNEVGAANLSQISTLTATISGPQRTAVSILATSTATIQAQRAAEIILSAFGDSQTTANGQRVRFADSTLASTTSISAVNETIRLAGASLALDFQQSTAANITASADVTMAGTSVSLTATARVRSGDIQANVESQMVINSVITASAELQILSTTNIAVPGERIRYVGSSQQVDTTTSADLTTIKRFSSELVSTSNQSVDAVKKVEAQAQIEGITISLTALSAIRQGAIDLSTQSTLTALSVITANGVATMQSVTESSITGIIKVDFEADLVSTTQVQTDNLRVRFNDAALATDSTQTADINYQAAGSSTLAVTSAFSATATGTIDISASISGSSALSASADRSRDNVISAVGETALAASTNNSRTRDNQSIIVSDSQVSANVGRVRPFDAQLVANTIDLFVAAKTGVAVVDMPMFTTLQANASVIARGIVPLVAQTESTATAVKTSNVSPQLIAQTTIVAEGTTNVLAEANVAVTTALTAIGSVIYRSAMSSQTTSNLTANAVARRGFAILDQSSGTMTVTGNRIRQFSSNFASISIDLIIGQKVVSFNAALVATSTLTALGRDIDLAKYVYIIPNEIRTWTIAEENRTRAIKEETRIYKIRRF